MITLSNELKRSGDFETIGGINTLTTLVDTHLASFAVIWAAAGTPHAVFPTTYDELLALTAGTPVDVAAGR